MLVLKDTMKAYVILGYVSFGGAPTQAVNIEFKNLLLKLKNQRSGSKIVCDFSIILILRRIMKF